MYLRLILEEARRREIPVTLITSRVSFNSNICQKLLSEYSDCLSVKNFAWLNNRVISFIILFYLSITKAPSRKLIILTLDPFIWFIPLLNLFGSRNVVSVHLKTYRLLRKKRNNIFFKYFLRACIYHRYVLGNTLFTIDPVAKKIIDRLTGQEVFDNLSDPVDTLGYTLTDIKSHTENADNDLLVYGSINKTKAADKAIEFAASSGFSIIVAGKQTNEEKEKLTARPGNATFYDYFLEEADLAKLVGNSKVIWLGYEDNDAGSSGVLHTSVFLQKHFIVRSPSKYVRNFCKQYPTQILKMGDYQLIRVHAAPEEVLERNQEFQEAFFV